MRRRTTCRIPRSSPVSPRVSRTKSTRRVRAATTCSVREPLTVSRTTSSAAASVVIARLPRRPRTTAIAAAGKGRSGEPRKGSAAAERPNSELRRLPPRLRASAPSPPVAWGPSHGPRLIIKYLTDTGRARFSERFGVTDTHGQRTAIDEGGNVTIETPTGYVHDRRVVDQVRTPAESLSLEGVTLHSVVGGQGPALVLLHGWPQTWWAWQRVMPALAEHFTVIAVDLPGLGDSSKPRSGYDTDTVAQRIHGLVTELGYDEILLVGHDWGGTVAVLVRHAVPRRGAAARRHRDAGARVRMGRSPDAIVRRLGVAHGVPHGVRDGPGDADGGAGTGVHDDVPPHDGHVRAHGCHRRRHRRVRAVATPHRAHGTRRGRVLPGVVRRRPAEPGARGERRLAMSSSVTAVGSYAPIVRRNIVMYARSRPAVSISRHVREAAWNAMCHTQPADDGVRRSSHPNPGTSISMTTSRRTAARWSRRTSTATETHQSWPTRRDSSISELGDEPVDALRHGVGVVSAPRGLLESPRPGRSTAITVKCSASTGISRGRVHHVCGQPWSRITSRSLPTFDGMQRHALERQRIKQAHAPRRRHVGRGRTPSASRSSRCPLRRSQCTVHRTSATRSAQLKRARPVCFLLDYQPGDRARDPIQQEGEGADARVEKAVDGSSRFGRSAGEHPFRARRERPLPAPAIAVVHERRRSRAMTTEAAAELVVRLTVNGSRTEQVVAARTLLVHYVRETLGLTGTTWADTSSCGACTVLLEGRIGEVVHGLCGPGRRIHAIATIEGLADGEVAPDAAGLPDQHGLQCGYCTPGMVMAAVSWRPSTPASRAQDVRESGSRATCADAPGTRTRRAAVSPALGTCGFASAVPTSYRDSSA